MSLKSCTTGVVFVFLSMIWPASALAQSNPPQPVLQRESVQDLLTRLNPQQKQQFEDAGKSFDRKQYADALVIYKGLLTELRATQYSPNLRVKRPSIPETRPLR